MAELPDMNKYADVAELPDMNKYADVAELADAQVSDSCGYCFLVGSTPIVRTKKEVTNVTS